MSNLEIRPSEVDCRPGAAASDDGLLVEVLTARDVPLGGPRAMTVHRTLPQRRRSLIGAWCFADHYGPDDVSVTGGMDVPPHPHTGLQTVSWLFTGEIEHRDTMGNHAMVRPGELNLMTAGHGIAHTEVSTADTTVLHGVQLWVALPGESVDTARDFAHYVPDPVSQDGASVRVFLGEQLGSSSPVHTFTPLLGAELICEPGARVDLPVRSDFEHGILVDAGRFAIGDETDVVVEPTDMGYVAPGVSTLPLTDTSDSPGRVILLGGEPFGEEIIMWWNFLGRTHDDIVRYRDEWMTSGPGFERFGQVQGYSGDIQHLPAPELPNTRLKPRHNPPATR